MLVVLPLVRADHVNAFDGDSPADTPNLDALAGDSLRFDRAIPESMPALPARRALITGMRAFPFRDWRRTDGMPAVPGFNPIYDHQPVMTEMMRAGGVTTVYVSDNPILEGPRFPDVRRTAAAAPVAATAAGIDSELLPAIAPGDPRHRAHLPRGHRRAARAQGGGAVLPRRRPVRPGRRRRGARRCTSSRARSRRKASAR